MVLLKELVGIIQRVSQVWQGREMNGKLWWCGKLWRGSGQWPMFDKDKSSER